MSTNLSEMKSPAQREGSLQQIRPGFENLQSFELMQRTARLLSTSTLVPKQYRAVNEKLDRFGKVTERTENPNAIANCVVALNMAMRLKGDVLAVMQNLNVIEGRPSWSSQWVIAAINTCGRFSALHFEITDLGEKEVIYEQVYWENGDKKTRQLKVKIFDKKCIAWAIEKETGQKISSPAVTVEMAVKEGWYTKNGSKWPTMTDLMLNYRSGSFFGKLHSPEVLMGLHTTEELHDIVDVSPDGEVLSIKRESLVTRNITPEFVEEKKPSEPIHVDESIEAEKSREFDLPSTNTEFSNVEIDLVKNAPRPARTRTPIE